MTKQTQTLPLALIATFALAAACKPPQAKKEQPAGDARHTAKLTSEPAQVAAGTPATLIFTVTDPKGTVVGDLEIVHEKPMHVLIVSRDLSQFDHIHPDRGADGSYRVAHTFTNGGVYHVYADFTPPKGKNVVEHLELRVNGVGADPRKLEADKTTTKTEGGVTVTMSAKEPFRAAQEVMVEFAIADVATGQPVTDLQPYLGAMAHFVVISEDLVDFLHVHPMDSGKSVIIAHTSFPRAGLYKLWAQFQRAGQIIIVPFVIQVGEGSPGAKSGGEHGSSH